MYKFYLKQIVQRIFYLIILQVLRNWIEGLLSSNGTIAMDSEDMKKQTTLIFSVIVSIYCLGGMCGGLITNIWSKIFGRRGGIMANNIFIFAAAALMGLYYKGTVKVTLIRIRVMEQARYPSNILYVFFFVCFF